MTLDDARTNSPALKDLACFPTALVVWGEVETDEFKRQSQDFADQLPDVVSFEIKARNHFDILYDLTGDSAFARRILQLVR